MSHHTENPFLLGKSEASKSILIDENPYGFVSQDNANATFDQINNEVGNSSSPLVSIRKYLESSGHLSMFDCSNYILHFNLYISIPQVLNLSRTS